MKKHPLSLLFALAIIVASLIPVPEVEVPDVAFFDKWVHFLMYGILSALVYLEMFYKNRRPAIGNLLFAGLLLPALLGGLLELAQAYLTTCRSGDWLDAAANATGAVLATLLALPKIMGKR